MDPTLPDLDAVRDIPPRTPKDFRTWLLDYTGIRVPVHAVCRGHQSPWEWLRAIYFDQPGLSLCHGPRGGGKSFLAAVHAHARSRFNPRLGTRILGGSLQQSGQVYQAIDEAVIHGAGYLGTDADAIKSFQATRVIYRNGSRAEILAASSTSVRGPHVPDLKLDEIDEMKREIFDAALGMAQEDTKRGYKTTVVMTSTWHRQGGVMGELVERAEAERAIPLFRFCAFEILERCPDDRSGPRLEHCPQCPIQFACWEERLADGVSPPKAKLSSGHYSIDSLIQKARGVSPLAFKSDFLCRGPQVAGLYFGDFDESNESEALATYQRSLPVYLAVDSGHRTGAVWFQVLEYATPSGFDLRVSVLADYYAEDRKPEAVALDLLQQGRELGLPHPDRVFTDPAGDAHNGTGVIICGEYERAGLRGRRWGLERWPNTSVADSIALVQALVLAADGRRRLMVHPRCRHLIRALRNYRRAQRKGQWIDQPEDPQHPFEDMVDALRGGLKFLRPTGRSPQPALLTVPGRHVF